MNSSAEKARRKKKQQEQELKNKIKNMSKEALAAAVARKKECNARALMIVEQSLESEVEEAWLLDNLKHINQSHFQDIVEERAITRICGYPLCVKELTNVPKKMYKISTRENKVYDITDRKNYCSNNCYKAGNYLKDQLYTSPLWLRDCEVPVEYQVLSSSKAEFVEESGAGAEVDLGNTRPVKIDKLNNNEKGSSNTGMQLNKEDSLKLKYHMVLGFDTSKSDFMSMTPPEKMKMSDPEDGTPLTSRIESIQNFGCSDKSISSVIGCTLPTSENSGTINEVEEKLDSPTNNSEELKNKSNLPTDCKINLVCATIRKQKEYKKQLSPLNIVKDIEQKIESWFTLETMLYLLGQEKVRELLKISGYSENISPKKEDNSFYLKCQEIYKKLNILELKDKEKQKPSKPVPDYDKLRKETKEVELKVKSFFRGDAKVTFADDVNYCKKSESESDDVPNLPLIDHCEVMSSRRRIFMDRLNKVLPDMLSALELSQFRLGWEIKELVSTFNLSATNIYMRTPEWSLVAVVIIKLLTIHNEILNFAYSRDLTQKRLISYLLTYELDGGYPERFTSYLMDIERIASLLS